MAIALEFEGDDYGTFTAWSATGDFIISGFFDRSNLTEIVLGESGVNNFIANLAGGNVRVRINSNVTDITGVATTGKIPFSLTRTSGTVSYDFDGVTGSYTNTGTFNLTQYANGAGGSFNYTGRLYDDLILNDLSGDSRNYRPTDSVTTAGAPIVTDTVSGSNLTGVNMPTAALGDAGSAWVDLGGSGISLTPVTINSLSVSLNPVIVFNSALSLNPSTVNSDSISLNPSITFAASLELTPNVINSNSSTLDPTIQFGGTLDLTPSVLNSLSVALNPIIEFTSALVVAPQTLSSVSISLNPLIEFKSVINLTPSTLNSLSISLNPVITTGQVQTIGTVTAGFADDKYSVKYKLSGITVNFKE